LYLNLSKKKIVFLNSVHFMFCIKKKKTWADVYRISGNKYLRSSTMATGMTLELEMRPALDPESSDGVPVNAGYNLYISFLLIILLLFKYDLFIIQ